MSKTGSFLKSLIVVQTDESASKASKVKPAGGGKVTKGSSVVTPGSTTVIQGVADNKFIEALEKVIEQNNQPGQDYFEFKQAIENMSSMAGMDDRTKFQTVYTVLSLQGCKKDLLLSSLDKYVQIIQLEKTNFDAEMQSEYNAKVQSKLNEAESYKKELESLTKRLSELNTSILTLSQEAQTEEMTIRAAESNFKASADVIINEMLADKQKINTYIQ